MIFVGGDILSLVVRANGASIITQKKPNSEVISKYIVTGGLAIQVIFFGLFMLVSILFYRRLRRSPTANSKLISDLWQKYLFCLYTTSTLIMIRSVFRVVEYVQGNDGYLLSHEIFLYLLDSTLMVTVMLLFNIFHPTMITGLLNGTKAATQFRIRTLGKLGEDKISDKSLRSLRS